MSNLFANLFYNSGTRYLIILLIVLACTFGLAFIKRLLLHRIKHLKNRFRFEDLFLSFLNLLSWPLYLIIGIKVGISYFPIEDLKVQDFVEFLVFLITTIYFALIVQKLTRLTIHFIIKNRTFQGQDPDFDVSGLRFLEFGFSIIIWVVVLLFVLQNRNININALVGGLGVAGIAFAFALQNLVSDLFSSVSIYTDKPFVIGDYIQLGDDVGEVVKIGLKTTRIKNLKGGEIVISNKELSTSKIKNLSRVGKRKVFMEVKIEKENTEISFAKDVPESLKKIISEVPKAKFFASYLKEVSEKHYIYFLEFETNKMAFKEFVDLKNSVNIKLLETFNEKQIEFSVLN